jgi:hypothetical protein
MANLDRFQTAERDFMRIAERAGLPEPDEIHYREDDDELEFLWHDQKLAVVVELDEYTDRVAGPADDIPF